VTRGMKGTQGTKGVEGPWVGNAVFEA
jgi:hypothetical protein